eukprot:GAHX01001790.1.p1 GENE.GAHX01001790.1~~GAHX01001790.1.p1  ORF type:complete len:506 (-),score=95.31 GAHX01001790.1:16-1533(-)
MQPGINTRNPFNQDLYNFLKVLEDTSSTSGNVSSSNDYIKILQKCQNSILVCPLPICNFEDLSELIGFGDSQAIKCETFLKDANLYQENGYDRIFYGRSTNITRGLCKSPKPKEMNYIPKKNSAVYAIIMSLGDLYAQSNQATIDKLDPTSISFKKHEIIGKCSLYTSVPFEPVKHNFRNQTNHFYNGWSSVGTLKKRGLIHKPTIKTFQLTKEGMDLYTQMRQTSPVTISPPLQRADLSFENNEYKVVLFIDDREVKPKNDESFLIRHIQNNGLDVVKMRLLIGDFTFVLKEKNSNRNDYINLGVVIEKKRCSDLVASIKDGRYAKQKINIKRLNIEHKVFLIEGSLEHEMYKLPLNTLRQAIATTEFKDKFLIVHNNTLKETANFLIHFGSYLFDFLKTMTFIEIKNKYSKFNEFNKDVAKKLELSVCVKIAKKLCCIDGITPEKGMFLATKFESFGNIYAKMKSIGDLKERMNMFYNKDEKYKETNISKELSKRIYNFFDMK